MGDMVADSKRLRTHHPAVVGTPPSYDGVEFTENLLLRSVSQCAQLVSNCLGMAFDGFFAWAYQRFIAERSSVCIFSRVGFSHLVLLHVEAQELQPHLSFVRV